MDDQQARKVNEAAERFADSLTESYRAVAGRSVSAQELNAQLTQDFFKRVIANLGTQAEGNRALADDLIEQQRKQQEASQALSQESVNVYMDFLGSVFAFPREGASAGGPAGRDTVPGPREEPPPGEERPEKRGEVPTSPPVAREEPPPGEERPGRRAP